MASCDETAAAAEELGDHQNHVADYHGAASMGDLNNGKAKYAKANGGLGGVGRSESEKTVPCSLGYGLDKELVWCFFY